MGKTERFSLFLEDNRHARNSQAAYHYQKPIEVITANTVEELLNAFEIIQHRIDDGFHIAGWISYEAGLCLEDKLVTLLPDKLDVPLLKMGVFKGRDIISNEGANHYWRSFDNPGQYQLGEIRLNQSYEKYENSFNQIQNFLKIY